ncbi:potassium-transporting ATPase subunit KdpC [Comamonas sp. B-9]|uniref:potassium-transporting ATPase subunit KdpC n=1 Tax=Comamonas sp. B-9 TaxID=1055192 RepID=UPI00039552C1|nr:potassium-transporting ATPase subunit KdpC [Comamonas sp. B-9]
MTSPDSDKRLPALHAQQAAAPADAGWGRTFSRTLGSSARAAVLVLLLCGVAYPLATTGVAQALLPHAANGSLVLRNGQIVGSALIGQYFDSARYFHGRPSATTAPDPKQDGASIAAPYNAGLSGASNQGSSSQGLADSVAERVAQYRTTNGLAADAAVPVDAVTASASGLDPHISVANANLQLARVARERQLPPVQVQQLLDQATQQRTGYLLGEPRVNVLALNMALDALPTRSQP